MKYLLKQFIPPIFIKFINYFKKNNVNKWVGNYTNWSEAEKDCKGYNSTSILNVIEKSILLVISGEKKMERDSVLFDTIDYNFNILPYFIKTAFDNKRELNLIDFGGSLGSSYLQYKSILYLCGIKKITWSIVEQEDFVAKGKKIFENENGINFYFNLDSCILNETPNIIFFSSVLQYIENPYQIIKKSCTLKLKYIIISRIPIINKDDDIIMKQIVPESIYKATYPHRFFNLNNIINAKTIKRINANMATKLFDSKKSFVPVIPLFVENVLKVPLLLIIYIK